MKTKWLLILCCLLLTVCSCKKDGIAVGEDAQNINLNRNITTEKFRVCNEFQNNMVVQRDKPLPIWGKATTNTSVSIKVSWNSNKFSAVADQNGNWSVTIPAAAANASPQSISCQTDNANLISFNNILIGDVWLCAGQSNMVMEVAPVSPFYGVTNYEEEIQAAEYPLIRFQTIQSNQNAPLLDNFSDVNPWVSCSPTTVANVSAVGYFFARKLHTELNIPIGIIVSAFDGSSCYDWLNGGKYYGGMINPLTKLSIKGFLWYQGETDQHLSPASSYTELNRRLINEWRDAFAQGLLPFYLVQLTPFAEDYFLTDPVGGNTTDDYLARFREAQSNVLLTAGTGMAITMDVGEPANHHPHNKKPVGERLALLALKNTYNQDIQSTGPKYLSYSQYGNQLTINYTDGTAKGLNTVNNNALRQLFFVAGLDRLFRQAIAEIKGNTVVLTVPKEVQGPVLSVRYAFTNAVVTNLQNDSGLPAEPFRTDNW